MIEDEERVERLADGIRIQTAQFRRWLEERGGVCDGLYAICPCCGNPYLYLDIDYADPCPICLAPASAVAARHRSHEIARPEQGHPGISLREARRNFLRYDQVYPPGHPRYAPDGPRAPWYDHEIMCLTAELRPDEWDFRGVAEDYFQLAKRSLDVPRSGFWRVGGVGRPQCYWRAWDEPLQD
jgi:hypothetical protein